VLQVLVFNDPNEQREQMIKALWKPRNLGYVQYVKHVNYPLEIKHSYGKSHVLMGKSTIKGNCK